jgi:hypothetical protein
MAQTREVRGVATKVYNTAALPFRRFNGEDGQLVNATVVKYHATEVAAAARNDLRLKVVLNPGGWFTVTTKLRMNQFATEYGLPFSVYQKDYSWYVAVDGDTYELDGPLLMEFRADGKPRHAEKLGRVY